MKVGKKQIFKYSLLFLISLTLIFIFRNSMLTKESSSSESSVVTGWLEEILPEKSVISLFMLDNVRKIAHFVEFGVLSMEMTVYALFFAKNKKNGVGFALLFSFVAAFIDETIQIFSYRGSAVSDIWIDLFGVFSFSASAVLIYVLSVCIYNALSKKEEVGNGRD